MSNAPKPLLRACSSIPGQIELVRQRRKARANPIKKRTANEPASACATAKMSELRKIAHPTDMARKKPAKTKLRKKISSQKGATKTLASNVAYVVRGAARLCCKIT